MTHRNKKNKDQPTHAEPLLSAQSDLPETAPDPVRGLGPPGSAVFPVVGIGASAGGLEALEEFFSFMPPNSGIAFVVIMHLSPNHPSLLSDLIQRSTLMPVVQITDHMPLLPNRVHVIPPNRELGLLNGTLQLLERLPEAHFPLVIDLFFRSLADDRQRNAICVILSGSGSDGSLGLRQIKEHDGLVIAQDPATAAHGSMPRMAIQTDLVDYVLAPAEMGDMLVTYIRRAHSIGHIPALDTAALDALSKIFLLIRAETGHDFSPYRANTLLRRISKRMALQKLDRLADYIAFLRQNPAETSHLFYEILIGVTQFFRDAETFQVFEQIVLPQLFRDRTIEKPLRVWVPGCATGEEAYSLAMLIHEYKQTHLPWLKVDIFATDINPKVIEQARLGEYPPSISADVPEKYLKRYFNNLGHGYQIKSEIREMLIFAPQNLLKDPPFSRLDLISCRNLLIYLKPETQRKVMALFQYALQVDGFLFLGQSENISEFTDYFTTVDRKRRLFRRTTLRAIPNRNMEFFQPYFSHLGRVGDPDSRLMLMPEINYGQLTERALLDHLSPVGILVNEKYDILYTYGPVDLYLKLMPGEARLNILDMARSGLQIEATTAVRRVLNTQETVHCRQIRVKTNGDEKLIDLTVQPVGSTAQKPRLLMLIIEMAAPEAAPTLDQPTGPAPSPLPQFGPEEADLIRLQAELETTSRQLRNAIDELQNTNEEHRSYIEEIQSANEELQSANEELSTFQEELQSVNEELLTANTEIQSKNEALLQANNDLHNLLTATDIATIFLEVDLTIRRFTPTASGIINLIETDVGRPLKHIVSNLHQYPNLLQDAERVLDTLNTFATEVQTEAGKWYNMRILPYRTVDNVIDGLVLTFAEITRQKETETTLQHLNDALREARDVNRNIIDTLREGLLILDGGLRIESANRSFYRLFRLGPAQVNGQRLFELADACWDIPALRQALAGVIETDEAFENLTITQTFAEIGQHTLRLSGRQLVQQTGQVLKILLMIEDFTSPS